jgi:spore maturation protein CgeB
MPDKPLKEVVDAIRPDLLLLAEYHFLTGKIKRYEDIKEIKDIPKVSIEVDCYNLNKAPGWHKTMGIDFVINRAPFPKSFFSAPSVWLPDSVTDEFYLKEFTYDRFNKIVYIGGGRFSSSVYYKPRKKAIFLLERHDMLDYYPTHSFEFYEDHLRKYKCGLSCNLYPLNMAPNKSWEIAASGCLLFTSDFIGRELIFGDKLFIEYKSDCSDIIEKAEDILTHDYSDLAYEAWKIVGERHLQSTRIEELYNILTSILNGKKVEDRWNIG